MRGESQGVNVFSVSWRKGKGFFHPAVGLISRVVRKSEKERAEEQRRLVEMAEEGVKLKVKAAQDASIAVQKAEERRLAAMKQEEEYSEEIDFALLVTSVKVEPNLEDSSVEPMQIKEEVQEDNSN